MSTSRGEGTGGEGFEPQNPRDSLHKKTQLIYPGSIPALPRSQRESLNALPRPLLHHLFPLPHLNLFRKMFFIDIETALAESE